MNNVNSFKFYRDYYDLVNTLPKKDKEKIIIAIVNYMFEDIEPDLAGHNLAIFKTLSYQLNVSKNNSIRSQNHGAPEGNKNASKETNRKQTENKPKTNQSTNRKQTNIVSSFMFIVSSFMFNKEINNLLEEYLELRIKKKYSLSDSIITRLCNKLKQYGTNDNEKKEIILKAINGSWKDFYPLEDNEQQKGEVPSWFNQEFKEKEMDDEKRKQFEFITSSN